MPVAQYRQFTPGTFTLIHHGQGATVPRQSSAIPDAWPINITGHDVKPASWFLASSKNVRIHPRAQQAATEGSLNTLGWVKSVTVNVRTADSWAPGERGVHTLLDGHDRVTLALRRGEDIPVPIEYVDLDEEKENLFLLIVDELTSMAMKDKGRLDALLHAVTPQDASLAQLLSELAAREGLIPPNVEFPEYDESVENEVKYLECPECHHTWPA